MSYRGIASMRVHLYRWGELKGELRAAGFRIEDVLPLEDVSYETIRFPWLGHNWRRRGLDCLCLAALRDPEARPGSRPLMFTGPVPI